ncbi:MAG TPA: S24 family peptidase [Tepidisphaeraceae bacterium]|jgi:DNA polymerase V
MLLYSDNLSAGFPSAAEGYENEPLNLHALVVRNPAATFYYRVEGDTLRHESIRDGSILVVDRSLCPSVNRLVFIERDGAFEIVRFRPWLPGIVCGVVIACVVRL